MRKIMKYALLTIVVIGLWMYVEDVKENKEAATFIAGMTSYEGLYTICYFGDSQKNNKEFTHKFNPIYREHIDILDGYAAIPNPDAETLDFLDIKKTPIMFVFDHKGIIYRAHTLKELDEFLNGLEE